MGEIQDVSEENIDDDLKCEIFKKALTGVNMSKIQEDHNIDEETLSKCYRKWFTQDDKIVAKVMGEIQTAPEDQQQQGGRQQQLQGGQQQGGHQLLLDSQAPSQI